MFKKKKLWIVGVENLSFFELAILISFASAKIKSVNIYNVARMNRNFADYLGLQQKSNLSVRIYLLHSVS